MFLLLKVDLRNLFDCVPVVRNLGHHLYNFITTYYNTYFLINNLKNLKHLFKIIFYCINKFVIIFYCGKLLNNYKTIIVQQYKY